jgi:hypothetical protein
MTTISRFAYQLLLRLHPAGFQDEFGAEMLWIFDEEGQEGGTVGHLLFDGVVSLLRQRCKIHRDPGQLSIASGTVITSAGIGPLRLLQGGLTFCLVFMTLIQIFSHHSLFTVSVRWSDRAPCYTLSFQMPSHAEVVLDNTQ